MAERRLQVFHAVARNLSFTRAADELFMTQPAVTFQVRQLEEQYNARLFERGHARIALTPAGELVFEYAEKILALSAELETRLSEMTDEMRGPLPIGASATIAEFMLPRVLGEFSALYPRVRPRLIVANSESIENRIAEHSLDLGLIETAARNPGLESQVCCEDELVAICAADHPLAGFGEVEPQLLREYEFVSREPGSGTREVTDAYFRAAGVPPDSLKVLMELGSPEALKGVVGTGLGCAVVSRAVVEKELRLGTLAALPLKPRLTRSLFLVYQRDRFRSRLAGTFIDFAKQKLREFVL